MQLFKLSAILCLACAPLAAHSQQDNSITTERYLRPPDAIEKLVTAPRYDNVTLSNLSPDKSRFMALKSDGMPTLAQMGKPHVNLGGLQIDVAAMRDRNMTTRSSIGIRVFDLAKRTWLDIPAPTGTRITSPSWSPDGAWILFVANDDSASHLYLAEAATGKTRRITKTPLLATYVTSASWSGDGKKIAAVLRPEPALKAPEKPPVAPEPLVRINEDGKSRTRTYPDLLETPYEMALLEYLTTGQLCIIDVRNNSVRAVGKPEMIRSIDLSPAGDLVRVTTVIKPFAYIVPVSSFGTVESIWDADGKVMLEVSKRPLRLSDSAPGTPGAGGAAAGQAGANDKREISWHPDGDGLIYLQLEPAAPRAEGETGPQRRKDRVMHWPAPLAKDTAKAIYENDARMSSLRWTADLKSIVIDESPAGSAATGGFGGRRGGGAPAAQGGAGQAPAGPGPRTILVRLADPTKKFEIIPSRTADFYSPTGSLVMTRTAKDVPAVRTSSDGSSVYISGTLYSKKWEEEGPCEFVDKVSIADGSKQRIFLSSTSVSERITAWLDDDLNKFVLSRESPSEISQSFLHERSSLAEQKLTENVDYSPSITHAVRHRIQVTRPDGFKFWVDVTLPENYVPGNKLPAFFWFYPREFETQQAYDESKRTTNKNAFPTVGTSSKDYFITLGYALIEPDCPIVGPAAQKNDSYIPDLRDNLSATIDELERRGFIDRERLAIGGHSYGAFSTVNALAQTPFFKAGIAGDGAYNRTLTPNGFQSEQRTLWEARETYLTMSPLLYANQINAALLMYHGMEDQNVGTFLINSERLFHAMAGMGKRVALFEYPYEDHGQIAKETILDQWARFIAWLDKYVKNYSNRQPQPKDGGG